MSALLVARAQAGQRLADQARDLHLRDADALADLSLREILAEAQLQHDALTLGDAREQGLERRARLGALVAAVGGAKRLGYALGLFVARGARRVERACAVGAHRLHRVKHLLLG